MRIARDRPTRYLLLRVLALGVLVVIYLIVDWRLVRLGLGSAVSLFLVLLGHTAAAIDAGGDIYLFVDHNHTFELTTSCIYVDLVLISVPFWWRFQRPPSANAWHLAVLTISVLGFNVLRMALALHLFQSGISWQVAHNIPNILIYFAVIAATVLLALRSDRSGEGDKM